MEIMQIIYYYFEYFNIYIEEYYKQQRNRFLSVLYEYRFRNDLENSLNENHNNIK